MKFPNPNNYAPQWQKINVANCIPEILIRNLCIWHPIALVGVHTSLIRGRAGSRFVLCLCSRTQSARHNAQCTMRNATDTGYATCSMQICHWLMMLNYMQCETRLIVQRIQLRSSSSNSCSCSRSSEQPSTNVLFLNVLNSGNKLFTISLFVFCT